MLKHKLEEISNCLERFSEREDKAKFNMYMNLPHERLESIENERLAYYKNVIEPFIKTYKMNFFCKNDELYRKIQYLTKNCIQYIHFNKVSLSSIAQDIIQNCIKFNFAIDGKNVSRSKILKILESSSDPKLRKKAWDNFVLLGEKNKRLYVKLFHLRSEEIKILKFLDIKQWINYQYGLKNFDINISSIAHDVRRELANLLENLYNVKLSNLKPWDVDYFCSFTPNDKFSIQENQFENILKKTLKSSGYDLNKMKIRFYKVEIPYDGLCIGTFFDEAKILYNPRKTIESLSYLFHELGHAFHTIRQKGNDYLLASAESSAFSEGVATCFEKIVMNPLFLKQELKVKKDDIFFLLKRMQLKYLYDILKMLIGVEFERNVYLQNYDNIDQLYSNIYQEITGIEHPQNSFWASTIHFARDIYSLLDYLLAEMISNQTLYTIYKKQGYKNYLYVIPLIDKYYILPGGKIDWKEKIKSLTNSYLIPRFFIHWNIQNDEV